MLCSKCFHLFFIDPATPLNLQLIPQPPELWASWQAGPGGRDGYLLRLLGQLQWNISLDPGALNATFPGPLPTGHYSLELRVLAGPHHASTQTSVWLDGKFVLMGIRVGSLMRVLKQGDSQVPSGGVHSWTQT